MRISAGRGRERRTQRDRAGSSPSRHRAGDDRGHGRGRRRQLRPGHVPGGLDDLSAGPLPLHGASSRIFAGVAGTVDLIPAGYPPDVAKEIVAHLKNPGCRSARTRPPSQCRGPEDIRPRGDRDGGQAVQVDCPLRVPGDDFCPDLPKVMRGGQRATYESFDFADEFVDRTEFEEPAVVSDVSTACLTTKTLACLVQQTPSLDHPMVATPLERTIALQG